MSHVKNNEDPRWLRHKRRVEAERKAAWRDHESQRVLREELARAERPASPAVNLTMLRNVAAASGLGCTR